MQHMSWVEGTTLKANLHVDPSSLNCGRFSSFVVLGLCGNSASIPIESEAA